MSNEITKIGLGGSCHWCTEAIFQSLLGVEQVEQGWIAAKEHDAFSEAVIIHFNQNEISLKTLIEIHLHTHSCTKTHSMREKYRSAIYTYNETQEAEAKKHLISLQLQFEEKIITQVLSMKGFKLNKEEYLNYYYSNPEKPFCTNVVNPKLRLILNKFSDHCNKNKLILSASNEKPEA